MPMFSQDSFSKLSTCHIDLQVIFFEVIKHFDCIVLEGHRGEKAQDDAFLKGTSKLKWPNGKHNSLPSNAVDVAPYELGPKVDWNDVSRFHYFAGFVMGVAELLKLEGKITHGLRWGGDWDLDTIIKDEKFRDLSHYELII